MNDYTNLISPQNKVFFEETYNMELFFSLGWKLAKGLFNFQCKEFLLDNRQVFVPSGQFSGCRQKAK